MTKFLAWLRNEVRLLGLHDWSDGAYDGPAPCTAADPRCARVIDRLAKVAAKMRAAESRLLDGREITSAAATDVRVTILRAKPTPVRAVRRAKA